RAPARRGRPRAARTARAWRTARARRTTRAPTSAGMAPGPRARRASRGAWVCVDVLGPPDPGRSADRTDRGQAAAGEAGMVTASATQKLISSLDPRRAGELCRELLATAGVTVGGEAPWDIQVHD